MKKSCIEKVAGLLDKKDAARAAALPPKRATVLRRRDEMTKGTLISPSRHSAIGKNEKAGYTSCPS